VTLLEHVSDVLGGHGVAHALIGATALAVHGVSRSTMDQDLLVVDGRVLDATFWAPLADSASVDLRRGDADDPLAGVVRIQRTAERDVDVVVGRHAWQEPILQRAITIGGQALRVVDAADLVLLKLYAGGSQDRWDIEQLLALEAGAAIARTVDERVAALPLRSREIWASLRQQP
jgi:hypothetical protein